MLMRSLDYDITNYDPNCCIMCILFLTDVALFSKSIISILGTTMIMMTTCVPSCLENNYLIICVCFVFLLTLCFIIMSYSSKM